jgi:hypothetical protein
VSLSIRLAGPVGAASIVASLAALFGAGCGRIGYDELAENPSPMPGRAPPPVADGSSGGSVPLDGPAGSDASLNDDRPEGASDATVASGDGATNDAGLAADALDAPVEAAPEAAPSCHVASSASTDYCTAVPFLPEAPVIDGVVDCGLTLAPLTPVGWSGSTGPDATAQYAVAWRPGGVYFFVAVTDPSLVPADATELTWQGDAVEIYADSDGVYAAPPSYDNPGTRQFTIAAPPDRQSSIARAQIWYTGSVSGADWTSTQYRAFGSPTGYVVEAFVTGPDLGLSALSLAAGGQVGMDLSIDVSFPSDQGPDAGGFGNRFGQYYLRVASPDAGGGIPPFDPRAFCVPALAAP